MDQRANIPPKKKNLALFFRNHRLLVFLLLLTFLKGAVWATASPLFQAPDEQVHYASVQHFAEPKDFAPRSHDFPLEKTSLFDIKTQNLSPELRNYLEQTEFEQVRFHPDKKMTFIPDSFWGSGEKNVLENRLSRFIERYPAWFTNYSPVYYTVCGFLENIFSSRSIIDRVFIERLFSVFLTTLTVLFAYFVFREVHFGRTEAVLAAGIVSFQPMFTFMGTAINVDAPLFFGFTVFFLGAVRILNRKKFILSLLLVLSGTAISILSKAPGYFLVPAVILLGMFYVAQRREMFFNLNRRQKIISALSIGLFFVFGLAIFWQITMKYFSSLKPLSFFYEYIIYQFSFPRLLDKSIFYWADFGWLDAPIDTRYIYIIWALLALSFVGIMKILIKRRENFTYVLFFALIVAGFGLMIHYINLSMLPIDDIGSTTTSINIQGRYFFPVIIAKMALIIFGLSALFPFISRKRIVFALFAGMAALNLVGLLNYLIPRYYL